MRAESDATERLCVEKVFRPGLLTRVIYRLACQAPFPYRVSRDAILASYYRRRVAARVIRAFIPRVSVANPLYVRWDADRRALVLGSELAVGRGIRPAPSDDHMLRRWFKSWFKRDTRNDQPVEEISELLGVMRTVESLFHESGLVGSGWQVCPQAIVSTANLLRTENGYTIVDLESGIPALLVPYYVKAALRTDGLPMFDDVDGTTLRSFLETHWETLSHRLGRRDYLALAEDAERLVEHTARWKHSELAVPRHRWSILSREFRQRYKERCIDDWRRQELIDDDCTTKLRRSSRIYSRGLFLLGVLPGSLGNTARRLIGNQEFRAKVVRLLTDRQFRQAKLQEFVRKRTRSWQQDDRIPPERTFRTAGPSFWANTLLARLLPRDLHRWLTDAQQRRNTRIRMLLICVSGRFQSEYGRFLIGLAIRDWEGAGRFSPQETESLRKDLESGELEEYARCFGIHAGLKLLSPVMMPMKLAATAAFVATANPLYLAIFALSPVLRTAVTLWRMMRSAPAGVHYGEALLVGMLPIAGLLAYPVQMYASHRKLSTFILRDTAARIGRILPIYGGRDSRTEIAAIRSVNLVIELLEIALQATQRIRRLTPQPTEVERQAESVPVSRWDRLVNEQLESLQDAARKRPPIREAVAELLEQQHNWKAA